MLARAWLPVTSPAWDSGNQRQGPRLVFPLTDPTPLQRDIRNISCSARTQIPSSESKLFSLTRRQTNKSCGICKQGALCSCLGRSLAITWMRRARASCLWHGGSGLEGKERNWFQREKRRDFQAVFGPGQLWHCHYLSPLQ